MVKHTQLTTINTELLEALVDAEQYLTNCGYFAGNKALALKMRSAIAKAKLRHRQGQGVTSHDL